MLIDAAGVGSVPEVIFEINVDFGDLVAALEQEGAGCAVLVEGVAFVKEGVAEPVPVFAGHELLEEWLVFKYVLFELVEGFVIEVEVRPGVAAKGLTGGVPGLQNGKGGWVFVDTLSVDEAVGGWEMLTLERRQDGVGDLEASGAAGFLAVGGKVVEGDGHLLG